MEYSEFKRHLGKAALSVNEFASLIDVQPSSISNYAKKPAVPSTYAALAVILGDMRDRGLDFREVLTRFGIHIASNNRIAVLEDYRRRRSGDRDRGKT